MEAALFGSLSAVGRTLAVGVLAYVALVLLLRASGKRTLSKLNAFDLVVTVALGSTLATILLSNDVSFLEGAVAIALLVGLQFVLTWSSVRSPRVRAWIKSQPRLLFHNGRYLEHACATNASRARSCRLRYASTDMMARRESGRSCLKRTAA